MLVQYIAFAVLGLVIIGSFINFKKMVLIWLPAQMLFNAQVAVKYTSPAMSLTLAVDLFLLFFYFLKARQRKRNFNKGKFILTKPMMLILFSYIMSLIFGVITTTQGINAIIKYFAANFGVVFLAWKVIDDDKDIKLFVKVSVGVCLMVTILALSESILHDNLWLDFIFYNSPQDETTAGRMFYNPNNIEIRYGMVRARSFFGIHIAFGFACLMYFWLMQVLYVNKFKYIKTLNALILSFLLAAGVFMANAKTGYIGLVIILLGLYPIRKMLNLKIIIPLIAVIAVILIYFPEYLNNFISLFNPAVADEGGGSTVEGRQVQFAVAMNMFSENPLFGNGPGAISVLKNFGNNSDILGAESSIMQILPERGILGLISYLYLYVALFLGFKKYLPIKLLATFLLAIFVMEFATGLLDMAIWGTVLVAVKRMYQIRAYKLKHENNIKS